MGVVGWPIDFLPLPKQYGEMELKMQVFKGRIKDLNQQISQIKKIKSVESVLICVS